MAFAWKDVSFYKCDPQKKINQRFHKTLENPYLMGYLFQMINSPKHPKDGYGVMGQKPGTLDNHYHNIPLLY